MKAAGTFALIAIILGCGVWMFYYQSSQPKPGEAVAHNAPLCCPDCKKSWVGEITGVPAKCKFCGKMTAWEAVQCRNEKCKTVFAYVKDNSQEKGKTPKCPKCGGTALILQPMPDQLSER